MQAERKETLYYPEPVSDAMKEPRLGLLKNMPVCSDLVMSGVGRIFPALKYRDYANRVEELQRNNIS